jgi:hypothetical protein
MMSRIGEILRNARGWWTNWIVLLICVYWWALARRAFLTYFNADDVANLYFAWLTPWKELARQTVLFWETERRPIGQAFYKAVFSVSGFDPHLFHYIRIALFVVNIVLLYTLLAKLSSVRAARLLGLLGLVFHSTLWDLYASTGAVYDLLCCTFCLCALLLYVVPRSSGRTLGVAGTMCLVACALLAYGSKEVGALIGAVIAAYELTFHGVGEIRKTKVLLPVVLVLAVTVGCIAQRVFFPGPIGSTPAYKAVFSEERLTSTVTAYTGLLFDGVFQFSLRGSLLFWALVLGLGVAARSRLSWFGILVFCCFLGPMLVAPPRATGYVLYVPLVGLSCYLTGLFGALYERTGHYLRLSVSVFGLLAICIVTLHAAEWRMVVRTGRDPAGQREIRELEAQARFLCPHLPPDGKVLLVNPPFGLAIWQGQYILALKCELPGLSVRHVDWNPLERSFRVPANTYAAVLLYDPDLRRYSDITTAAEKERARAPLSSLVDMASPEARLAIVGDVNLAAGDGWRLCRAHPQFRIRVPPDGFQRVKMLIRVPDGLLRELGPLRMTAKVNGVRAGQFTVATSEEWTVDIPIPRGARSGQAVYVAVDVLNPWEPTPGGGLVSFLIRRLYLE